MSTPKFAVGEVVVLQSVARPELNGDYSVVLVVPGGGEYVDPHHGSRSFQSSGEGFAYILNDASITTRSSYGNTASTLWGERCLRKKHQPGTESFQDMMRSLKSPTNGTQSQAARW